MASSTPALRPAQPFSPLTDDASMPRPFEAPATYYAPKPVPSPAAASLSQLRADLGDMAYGLDAHFIHAGQTLAVAVETIDEMVGALENITSALDGEAAASSVADFVALADRLSDMPAHQAGREAELQQLADTASLLRDEVEEMQGRLFALRIFGINMKIAAAGTEPFVGFVDKMNTRITQGEDHLSGISQDLVMLVQSIAGVRQSGQQLLAECASITPRVPDRLRCDASDLGDFVGRLGQIAATSTATARGIQGRIAVVLGALQISDITRQRLEHVAAMLELVEQPGELDPASDADIQAHIHRLAAAHIETIAEEFGQESDRLVAALRALAPDTAHLLELILAQGTDGGRAFLQRLEQAIGEIGEVTAHLDRAQSDSQRISSVITDMSSRLGQRFDQLRVVRNNLQDIAINTRLMCRRLEGVGRAVSVVAGEIAIYANHLEQAMARALVPARRLQDTSQTMAAAPTDNSNSASISKVLARALAVIGEGCQSSEIGVGQIAEQAANLVGMLEGTAAALHRDLSQVAHMRAIAQRLQSGADASGPRDAASQAALAQLLHSIAGSYSMAAEREVHRRFLLPGMELANIAPSVPAQDLDDRLF